MFALLLQELDLYYRMCAVVTKTTNFTLDFSCLQYLAHFVCSTVEHVHYGHPNVIILGVAYAFTLQDIVTGASQYVLSAVTS